jgi:putative membrane-bound dehydrogenase-like protein
LRQQERRWVSVLKGVFGLLSCAANVVGLCGGQAALADDDALVFTPPGFGRPGAARTASGAECGRIKIAVRDRATNRLTPCRINVVGADGDFYQPADNRLSAYSLTGQWPTTGKGNRQGKGPFRYLGRFFYTTGEAAVSVPAGRVRIEVWKGFEYQPLVRTVMVAAGADLPVSIELERSTPMSAQGYYSGDTHLHFPRRNEADDQTILDLLEAEDIQFGSILAYNEPAGPYTGMMETMAAPQLLGLGQSSVKQRGSIWIASGQEYRSATYGHLNLYWQSDLVLKGQKTNADNWPLYGDLSGDTMRMGGFAIYAHGGYSQAIHADFVQKHVSAVELLQFGVYRGIELAGWYDVLNIGYRFPCVGASDYPACRKLGDCQTYVLPGDQPGLANWLKAAAEGRSFVTTGPLLLLEVDGQRPGGMIRLSETGAHRVRVTVRVKCNVAPVQSVQVIAGGKVVVAQAVPPEDQLGRWIELDRVIDLDRSSWIAARAFGVTGSGAPDAEAHTNPVYVDIGDKAPYNRDSLDRLIGQLDGQMAAHRKRSFAEKARVLDYFQKSRNILLRIRQAGGLPAGGIPEAWTLDSPATAGIDPSRRSHQDEELKRFLEPLAAKTPVEALKTFEAVDGFRMELVAAEPLVQSPVAAAFDAQGNLYVAEMRDYPYKPKPGGRPLGTIRLLRDRDGDGRFEESHIFADGLLWAAGIAPWKDGVFVTAAPDILYLKDTDHDGKADLREKVYTGFGTQNQQAMVNNLTWGLDHMIYGAAAGNGGTIRPASAPEAAGVSVEHNDFRFDPVTASFEPISGSDQFGNTFDDWGNRFICDESHPLSQPVLPRRELARNPVLALVSVVQDIAGGSVPIFRISPVERWRQIRSSRRIAHGTREAGSAGASHHVVDAGAGVTIYRGGTYPADFYGNAFIGDAQNNLVHRRILVSDGPTFKAIRGPREQATEFVRSSDNWFRPVNFVNAPDGTLYVLDMSREVIEAIHIPLDVVKHLNLKRGRDQGRIYRIAPPGFKYVPPPRLSQSPTAELIAALRRPDAWYRDTAHRLIYERQDSAAIAPLREMLGPHGAPLPQSRVNALWSLHGLKALEDRDILSGLDDPVAEVRASAVQLAARRLRTSKSLLARVLALADLADPAVCFQTALAIGESDDPRVAPALLRMLRRYAANQWIRSAVLCSSSLAAADMLVELSDDAALAPSKAAGAGATRLVIDQLAEIVGARNRRVEVDRVLDHLAMKWNDSGRQEMRDGVITALARGTRRSGGRLEAGAGSTSPGSQLVATMIESAKSAVLDSRRPDAIRALAIAQLGVLNPRESQVVLARVLEPREPLAVQVAAVRALAESESPEVAKVLLSRLRGFEPSVRAGAIQTLLSRANWTKALLEAVSRNEPGSGINPGLIEPADRQPLLKNRDAEIARTAQKLFASGASGSRAQVIALYAPALQLKGDPAVGAKVFERECRTCHKIGERGFSVGPDLTGSPSRDPTALLLNILDPNASVSPKDVQYVVVDQNGRTYSGIIAAETATSLTLRRGEGAQDTILRGQVEELTSTGMSLMPEGFENRVSKPEMADLIAFICGAHRDGDSASGQDSDRLRPLDVGTLPGLIEPDE